MNNIRKILDPTERRIYDTLEKYRCLTLEQLSEFVPPDEEGGITSADFSFAIRSLRGKNLIDFDASGNMARFTKRDEWDVERMDCIWVMLDHIWNQERVIDIEKVEAAVASPAASPLRLVYAVGENAYYVVAVRRGDEAGVYVAAEYLRQVIPPDDRKVKVIAVTWDEGKGAPGTVVPEIPDFDVMVAHVCRRADISMEPDVEFTEVRPASIPRKRAQEKEEEG